MFHLRLTLLNTETREECFEYELEVLRPERCYRTGCFSVSFMFRNRDIIFVFNKVYREDNIKMDLQEVGGGRGDWMELAQDRDRWRALMGTVRDFRVP